MPQEMMQHMTTIQLLLDQLHDCMHCKQMSSVSDTHFELANCQTHTYTYTTARHKHSCNHQCSDNSLWVQLQGLTAVQAVLTDEGSMGKPWSAGAAGQAPGKRKRSRRKWCLQHMADVSLQDEVSCIHLLPFPQGDPALHTEPGNH